jgi:hypothetical protein
VKALLQLENSQWISASDPGISGPRAGDCAEAAGTEGSCEEDVVTACVNDDLNAGEIGGESGDELFNRIRRKRVLVIIWRLGLCI